MNINKFPWEVVKLKTLCEVQLGKTPLRREDQYWDGGTNKWLSISDMTQERYVFDTSEYMTDYAVEDCNIKIIPKGTVLLSFKLTIGKVNINKVPLSTNEAIAALLIKDESKLDRDYLYWVLQVIDLMQSSDKAAKGNTLNKGKIQKLDIPLPPLETQKKIAAVLDQADALRQKRRQTIDKLDELSQSVFLDMFGDTLINSKSFPTKKASEVVNVNPRKPRDLNADDEELISFLPMDAVSETGSQFDYEEKRSFKDVSSGYTYFNKGDVLLAKITPCLENGKSCIANIGTDFGFGSTEFHVFEPNEKLIAEYLYYFISNKNFLKSAEEKMTGSAGQQRVPTNWIKDLELPVPPMELQEEFKQKVVRIGFLNEKFTVSVKELNDLFNSLLQKAFKGELDFSDSEDQLLAAEEAAEYSA